MKLAPNFYSPKKVLERIRPVAYCKDDLLEMTLERKQAQVDPLKMIIRHPSLISLISFTIGDKFPTDKKTLNTNRV